MKKHYPGFYKPSKESITLLWQNATVVFDTNVLLDFYRVSSETAQKLIEIVAFFADQNKIFIPNQVAKEYHRNLLETVLMQKAKYSNALKSLKEFEQKVSEKRNHPYLTAKLKERFSSLLVDIESSFKEQTLKIEKILTQPSIKDKLAELLDGKVGDGYSEEELKAIKEEGSLRYAEKVPPGFKDADKSSDNQYGDLIIWKEVLDYAKSKQTGIIYVSSDVKDDWYLRLHGVTYGPHPELIKEFIDYTNQNIYLYSLDMFLIEANKQKVVNISQTSLDEVENVIRTKRDTDMGSLIAPGSITGRRHHANESPQFLSRLKGFSSPLSEMMRTNDALGKVTGATLRETLPHISGANLFGSLKSES